MIGENTAAKVQYTLFIELQRSVASKWTPSELGGQSFHSFLMTIEFVKNMII